MGKNLQPSQAWKKELFKFGSNRAKYDWKNKS